MNDLQIGSIIEFATNEEPQFGWICGRFPSYEELMVLTFYPNHSEPLPLGFGLTRAKLDEVAQVLDDPLNQLPTPALREYEYSKSAFIARIADFRPCLNDQLIKLIQQARIYS